MAQWEHKEATWHAPMIYGSEGHNEVTQIMLVEGALTTERWPWGKQKMTQGEFREKGLSFTQWLDFHCLEGWEVFKISRDFNRKFNYTWCVFRRLV